MMKKVLIINCHPLLDDENATTIKLANYTNELMQQDKSFDIEILNLYDEHCFLPRIDEQMFGAWSGQNLTNETQDILDRQNELIEQFISADVVLIFSPLHNFNITSKFKDYVDNILIARRTFKYTENGSVGLLNNDKKVAYIQSSGSEYSQDFRYISLDFAPNYVRGILSIMGITKMKLIRAEGMNIAGANREQIIESAKTEISNYIHQLKS